MAHFPLVRGSGAIPAPCWAKEAVLRQQERDEDLPVICLVSNDRALDLFEWREEDLQLTVRGELAELEEQRREKTEAE